MYPYMSWRRTEGAEVALQSFLNSTPRYTVLARYQTLDDPAPAVQQQTPPLSTWPYRVSMRQREGILLRGRKPDVTRVAWSCCLYSRGLVHSGLVHQPVEPRKLQASYAVKETSDTSIFLLGCRRTSEKKHHFCWKAPRSRPFVPFFIFAFIDFNPCYTI